MIINHNLSAMNAQRQMGVNQANATKSMEKLSSGLRINRAGDDAAGLAISEKMRGQIRGLDQANRNAQDGISMIQTAEGALTETHSILQRMRELSVQAANDTNVENDREEIQNELNQLIEEIDRIGNNTEFNTQKLLDGGAAQKVGGTQSIPTAKGTAAVKTGDTALGSSVSFATDVASKPLTLNGENVTLTNVKGLGDTYDAATNIDDVVDALQKDINAVYNGTDHDGVTFTVGKTDDGKITITSSVEGAESKVDLTGTDATAAATLGLKTLDAVKGEDAANTATTTGIDVSTSKNANEAIETIDKAITAVSAQRSKLGAWQNRLEHTINNLGTSSENLTAAESRVRDVDMAKEMMEMSKNNILQQASQAMLAQANQNPQQVLQLLR